MYSLSSIIPQTSTLKDQDKKKRKRNNESSSGMGGKLDVQCKGYWFDHGVKGMLYLYKFSESDQGLFIVSMME